MSDQGFSGAASTEFKYDGSPIHKKDDQMPNYIIAYHGGKKPESPEQGAEQMAKWKAWVAGLGAAIGHDRSRSAALQ